jgi:hypothetical protein
MFAGTSTGSILSSGLSTAHYNTSGEYEEPMYWAEDVNEIYIKGRPIIFTSNVGTGLQIFMCYAIYFCIFGLIFFMLGRHKYNNPKKFKAFKTMQDMLDENKMHLLEICEKNE